MKNILGGFPCCRCVLFSFGFYFLKYASYDSMSKEGFFVG